MSKATRSPHRLATLRARARGFRLCPTPSEELLWQYLRHKQLGVVFRRQCVLGDFIVDFLASSVRLIVEVDGGYHAERVRLDAKREARLRRKGYRVVRVGAEEVVESLPAVLARIALELAEICW